jgi:hypothetical protein
MNWSAVSGAVGVLLSVALHGLVAVMQIHRSCAAVQSMCVAFLDNVTNQNSVHDDHVRRAQFSVCADVAIGKCVIDTMYEHINVDLVLSGGIRFLSHCAFAQGPLVHGSVESCALAANDAHLSKMLKVVLLAMQKRENVIEVQCAGIRFLAALGRLPCWKSVLILRARYDILMAMKVTAHLAHAQAQALQFFISIGVTADPWLSSDALSPFMSDLEKAATDAMCAHTDCCKVQVRGAWLLNALCSNSSRCDKENIQSY